METKYITNIDAISNTGPSGTRTNIILTSRDSEGKRKHEVVSAFNYYFYIREEDKDTNIPITHFKGKVRQTYKNENVIQLIFNNIFDAQKANRYCNENGIQTFEADIDAELRYLLDNKHVRFSKNQVICYLDIETEDSIDAAGAMKPIICITAYDTHTKKYNTFIWREDFISRQTIDENKIISYCSNEKEMFDKFIIYLNSISPEIITGWNCRNFDIPYIYNRLERLFGAYAGYRLAVFNYARMMNDRESKTVNGRPVSGWTTHLSGRNVVDLLDIYRAITYWNKPENYQLNTVSKLELNDSKLDHGSITEEWRSDVQNLINYNVHDVELIVKLDEKKHLIDYVLSVQYVCPLQLYKVRFFGKTADAFVLHQFTDKFVFPSKNYSAAKIEFKGAVTGKIIKKGEDYEGIEPDPGVYKNAVFFDFASMYPSLYRTFNISNDTISDDGDISAKYVTIDGADFNMESIRFNSSKKGFIPEVLENLDKLRSTAKKERDKFHPASLDWLTWENIQGSYKTIANSLFGALGLQTFRLYDVRIPATITFLGRSMLGFSAEIAKKNGYEPLYGDTDSLVVSFGKDLTIEQVKEEADKLQNLINDELMNFTKMFYPGATKHYLKIEYEKIFSELILLDVKKKYVGTLKFKKGQLTDELYFRGIELVKKDMPRAFKPVLEKVIYELLASNNIENIKKIIAEHKKVAKQETAWNLGFIKTMSKDIESYKVIPQHIKAIKYSNSKLGTMISRGDSPKILYVKHRGTDLIALESEDQKLPEGYQIDYDRLFDMFIYQKLEQFTCINKEIANLNNDNMSLLKFLTGKV